MTAQPEVPMQGSLSPNPHLIVRDTLTPKGRGVFAARDYAAGETVEQSPVRLFNGALADLPDALRSIVFDWGYLVGGPADQQYAIVLGLGSIFNHANDPSLVYAPDESQMALAFVALRDIPAGTELTVSYNQDIGPGQPDWFQSMGFPPVD